MSTAQYEELPDIAATISSGTTSTATCTVTDPSSGFSVYYRTSTTGSWTSGNTFTSTLTSDGSQTVYFKVEADGYKTKGADNSFGWKLTRKTTTPTMSGRYPTSGYEGPYSDMQSCNQAGENAISFLIRKKSASNTKYYGPQLWSEGYYFYITYNYPGTPVTSWSGTYS